MERGEFIFVVIWVVGFGEGSPRPSSLDAR